MTKEFYNYTINGILNHLKMTKNEAKSYLNDFVKINFYRLLKWTIYLMILLIIFSMSVGFSLTLYTGIYIYMIPIYEQK
jgi:hypothetical protein